MTDPVDGNREVQNMLQRWLATAQEGDLKFMALVACRSVEDVAADLAGARGCEFAAYYGLDRLKRSMVHALESNLSAGLSNASFPANRWMYYLDQYTTGYDFMQWMINIDLVRRQEGCTDPLKIYFHPKEGPQRDMALSHPGRKELFYQVVKKLIPMFGAEETEEEGGRVFDPLTMLSYKYLVKAHGAGWPLPRFNAPQEARDYVTNKLGNRKPVVLTLREAEHNSYRNSPVDEWIKFATWLKCQGEDVIFLRDTRRADEPLEDWETWPEASKDTYIRMALYERARCCVFGSTGPCGLVTISDVPWIIVYPLDDNKAYTWNNPDKWERTWGIKVGEQVPWATPHQKILLKPEKLENFIEAWQMAGLADLEK